MSRYDATIYSDKPQATGGTVYNQVDRGLIPPLSACHFEALAWRSAPSNPLSFDAALFIAWYATIPVGRVAVLDLEPFAQRWDPRYYGDASTNMQSHAMWGALQTARASNPGRILGIYGFQYNLAYPWIQSSPQLDMAKRKAWGTLDPSATNIPATGPIAEADMPYAANHAYLQTITSIGRRPIDLCDYWLIDCYCQFNPVDVQAQPTIWRTSGMRNIEAAAAFGLPRAFIMWDRYNAQPASTVPMDQFEDCTFTFLGACGTGARVFMWSSPGQSYTADGTRWLPFFNSAYERWAGTGSTAATAEPHIPQPLIDRPGLPSIQMREITKLLGQPSMQAYVRSTSTTPGLLNVTVQVVSSAREPCRGCFRLHVFLASSPGGVIVQEFNAITNAQGQAEFSIVAGAGDWVVHASVLGVYYLSEVTAA